MIVSMKNKLLLVLFIFLTMICSMISFFIAQEATINRYITMNQNRSVSKITPTQDAVSPLPKRTIEITAHRGVSQYSPENTLTAINNAIFLKCDYVEIDVQETKDCKLVVFHDDNLERITGLNQSIWDTEFHELQKLDAGSWFHDMFRYEKIPSLEEVLALCKEKIKINFDVKADKHNHIVNKLIEQIIKYDFVQNCYITSTDYNLLAKVKNQNPTIKTGYITAKKKNIKFDSDVVDMFSISKTISSKKLVVKIHESGKLVHVWTVNSKRSMLRMKKYGIDNIITNDPQLAINLLS